MSDRAAWFPPAVAVVAAAAATVSLVNLTTATLLPDEAVYVEAGQQYADGVFELNRQHPPLAKLLFGWAGELVGDPVLGGRLVAVAAGLAIAVALFVLVRRLAGRWWGLAAAGLWVVVPHALRFAEQPWGGFDRLDRYAMLDPVATAFATWAVVVAVGWRSDRRLRWGLLAGALVGLAAGSKLSGGLLVVVVAAVPWCRSGAHRHGPGRAVAETAMVGAAALGAFASTYAPLGSEAVGALAYMLDFQATHAADGHDVVLAGQAYTHAPWWTHAWYTWRDDGWLLATSMTVAALLGALGGVGARVDRALVAAAVVVPAVVFALSPVGLPHYRFLWLPAVVALAALGLAGLTRRGWGARLAAAVLVVAMLATGLRSAAFLVTRDVADYRAVAALLEERGQADATVLVEGFPRLLTSYLPALDLADELPADVVVLDPKRTELVAVPDLRARLRAGAWRHVEVDRLDVWLPSR